MNDVLHLSSAIKEALKSSYSIKVGCVIFKGKKVISKGYNVAYFPVRASKKYTCWKTSLHAELSAIVAALRKGKNLSGSTLLVIRLNKNMELMTARPCKYCMRAILDLTPINKITYSCTKNKIVHEKINQLRD